MERESERKELWHQLDNESDRAHEAFKVYMYLPPAERSVARTWREWTDNPEANRPSPFFEEWAREYAWSERARAYDAHIERIRQKGLEDAIYAEAKKQSRVQERMRGNLSEQLINYHQKVMGFLEQVDVEGMRFSDAIAVTRLYLEHVDKFGAGDEAKAEDEWTEEDDEFLREAAERVRQRRMARDNGGDDPGSEAVGIQGAEGGEPEDQEEGDDAESA
jgi:hypothetical protein